MSDIMKTGFRLFIITLIAAICLGLTNLATEEPIRQQQIRIEREAKQATLPQSEEFEDIEIISQHSSSEATEILEINVGKSKGHTVGYTFKIATLGFGGDMEIIVGINMEDEIEGIEIGVHSETPGLGANMEDRSFADQYKGKGTDRALNVSKSGAGNEEIHALTGATVTSDAVTRGVNLASQYYREVFKDGGGEQ